MKAKDSQASRNGARSMRHFNSISSDRGGIRIDDDTKVVLEHFTVER